MSLLAFGKKKSLYVYDQEQLIWNTLNKHFFIIVPLLGDIAILFGG